MGSTIFNLRVKSVFDNINYNSQRKTTAYLSIITLFTDLFLSISPFGEVYYKKEGLEHKINIKIGEGEFNTNIPSSSIKIIGEEDRRCALISFKCKNPTAHKIGVLIVKDFEERITKIEEAFKELNLKLYYIRPKVEKDGYEMDNYNFEAYIPTLLPLLTGDNLYSQKEVFIRELIQNSYDAIRLREKLDHSDFNKNIYIEIGSEKRENGTKGRFLRIKDFGVGMDLYKIERYFTSIGRSFYTSDDFEELQRDKKIQYKAVSNFGIGFLSVFMVCKEVKVKTRSLLSETGIDIHIPNYEGCFFINKNNRISQIGTEITIYQDERTLINTSNIVKYVRENFLDFGLNIYIKYPNKLQEFEANRLKRDLPDFSLFVPFDEDGVKDLSVNRVFDKSFIKLHQFGCFVNFDSPDKTLLLNSGIKVNTKSNYIKLPIDNNYLVKVAYNFPSSFISLDVSRDRIQSLEIKDVKKFNDDVINSISKQAFELIDLIEKKHKRKSLLFVNKIVEFGLSIDQKTNMLNESYSMIIKKKDNNNYKFIPCKNKHLDKYMKDVDVILGMNIYGTLLFPENFEKFLTDSYNISKSKHKVFERLSEVNSYNRLRYKERYLYQTNESLLSDIKNIQDKLNQEFKKLLKLYVGFLKDDNSKNFKVSFNKINKFFEEDDPFEDSINSIEEIKINERYINEFSHSDIGGLIISFIYQPLLSSYSVEEIERLKLL